MSRKSVSAEVSSYFSKLAKKSNRVNTAARKKARAANVAKARAARSAKCKAIREANAQAKVT